VNKDTASFGALHAHRNSASGKLFNRFQLLLLLHLTLKKPRSLELLFICIAAIENEITLFPNAAHLNTNRGFMNIVVTDRVQAMPFLELCAHRAKGSFISHSDL
jgi:hypothetical protein